MDIITPSPMESHQTVMTACVAQITDIAASLDGCPDHTGDAETLRQIAGRLEVALTSLTTAT